MLLVPSICSLNILTLAHTKKKKSVFVLYTTYTHEKIYVHTKYIDMKKLIEILLYLTNPTTVVKIKQMNSVSPTHYNLQVKLTQKLYCFITNPPGHCDG